MSSEASSSKVLPDDYTFIGANIFISKRAKEVFENFMEEAENRNPDLLDMYVYNERRKDYYPYGLHNLLESVFKTIRSKVNKKEWRDAFYDIEALTVFFQFESLWTTCDDGDLTMSANTLYGALLVAILKGLKDNDQLDPAHFPNLETVLRLAAEFGKEMENISCKSEYATVCKAVANHLFKDAAEAHQALYEARLREFAQGLDEDEETKEETIEDIDKYVKKVKGKTPWFLRGKIGRGEMKNATSVLTRAWNDYKGKAPPAPLKGPPEWDLTKWTDEQRRPYEYEHMYDEEDF